MASTKAINQRLVVAKKERQKREKMIEKEKTKAIAGKRWRIRIRISLFSEEKRNYESDIKDKIDLY